MTPESVHIFDGELRATLFLLRNAALGAPVAERIHTDSSPGNDRHEIRYGVATTPKGYVLTHGHPIVGLRRDLSRNEALFAARTDLVLPV